MAGASRPTPIYVKRRKRRRRSRRGREREMNREDKVTDDYVSKRDGTRRIREHNRGWHVIRDPHPELSAQSAGDLCVAPLINEPVANYTLTRLHFQRVSPVLINEMYYSEDVIQLNCNYKFKKVIFFKHHLSIFIFILLQFCTSIFIFLTATNIFLLFEDERTKKKRSQVQHQWVMT